MFDLVMFDLDGTLVDTAPEITDAVNDALALMGLRTAPDALVREWIGPGTYELMVRAYAWAAGWSTPTLRGSEAMHVAMGIFEKTYARRCGSRSDVYPGVRPALARLRKCAVRTAVVTNKEERFARAVLAAHGLEDSFTVLVAGDLLPQRKPHPLQLQHCLRLFGTSGDRALFVGDSQLDLDAALAAGVKCWLVSYGYDAAARSHVGSNGRVISSIDDALAESTRSSAPPSSHALSRAC